MTKGGRDALAVPVVGAALGLLAYGAWVPTRTCEGFACLGADLVAAAVSGVIVPALAWLTLWLVRVPRAFLLAVTAGVTGHVLAWLAGLAQDVRAGFTGDVPLAPAWAYLVCGAAAGAVAVLVAGRGPWRRWVRLGVLGGVAALAVAGWAGHVTLETRHAEEELEAVPVTAYLPELEGARPSYARVGGRGAVQISYSYDDHRAVYPDVHLVPVAGADLCEAVTSSRISFLGIAEGGCTATGDEVTATDRLHRFVGVRREDTLLVASYDVGELDDADVLDRLRSAPRTGMGTLARLGRPW